MFEFFIPLLHYLSRVQTWLLQIICPVFCTLCICFVLYIPFFATEEGPLGAETFC